MPISENKMTNSREKNKKWFAKFVDDYIIIIWILISIIVLLLTN